MNSLAKLIILLFLYVSCPLFSQKDTSGHVGYVISKQNDTIRGFIYNHHKYSHTYIVVKNITTAHKDSTFFPQSVLGYVANNKIYKTIKLPMGEGVDSVYQFAEVIIDGPLALYETKIKTDFILPPKKAFLVEKTAQHQVLPFGKIYSVVPLVEDYEQLKNDILSYKYDNTLRSKKMVCELYNEWIQKNKN